MGSNRNFLCHTEACATSRKRPLKCGAEYTSGLQGRAAVAGEGVCRRGPAEVQNAAPPETRTGRRLSGLLRYVRTQLRNFKAAPRISAGFSCVIISRLLRGAAVNSIVPFYCMFLFLERRCCIGTSSFNVLLEDGINSLLRCAALQSSLGFSAHSCPFRPTIPSS